MEIRANLDIVGWEERAPIRSLVLITGLEDYLSLRAALGIQTQSQTLVVKLVLEPSKERYL